MKKNTLRWWDFLTAGLLMTAMGVVAMRLRITDWTPDLGLVELLTYLACILGMALGYSRFSGGWARLFGLAFTLFFVPMQIGLVFEKGPGEWWDRLNNLYARLYWSVFNLLNNNPVQDSLLFVSLMAVFFWFIAILAGYQLTRNGKPWAPIVIAGLGMVIIDFYTPYVEFRDSYSGIFVLLVLFLLARLYHLHSRREWNERGMTVEPGVGFDMGRSVAISGLFFVLLAWNFPSLVEALTPGTEIQRELASQWESVRDRLQNAVAGLQSKAVATNDFFGGSLNLGVGGGRDNEKVFTIQLAEAAPAGVRFYWRARSYDFYNGLQWTSTIEKSVPIGANEWPFNYPNWKDRTKVNLTFTALQNSIRNIYLPAFPLSIGRAADVVGKVNADNAFDFVGALSTPAIRTNDRFDAQSWISQPIVQDLRAAVTDFPLEIKQTYLQLPLNFNRRIRSLAVQITADKQTQYDRVMAITSWLRQNITYKETIDSVPNGRDPIEWFLFEYKKGFCNYYATSEVLMLRSLGIPARLAVGYAEGTYDETNNSFEILRRDSHAWPEVYFEGFGWIEFEPTAGQPALVMLDSAPVVVPPVISTPDIASRMATEQADIRERDRPNASSPVTEPASPFVPGITVAAVLLLLVGLFLWLRRNRKFSFPSQPVPALIVKTFRRRGWQVPDWLSQWARLSELSAIERIYIRMGWNLPLLGLKTSVNQTPAERLGQLCQVVPEAELPIAEFLDEYQRAEYSAYTYDLAKARLASSKVWRLTLRTLFRRVVKSDR